VSTSLSRLTLSICLPLYQECGQRVINVVGDSTGVVGAIGSVVELQLMLVKK